MTKSQPAWIRACILTGACLFIFALAVSAVFDPRIRLLHILQALIYIGVVVSTRRNSAWGFGAGFVISAFWNYINLFVTNFVRSGLAQLASLVQTGHANRPDQLIALIAAAGHFLLMAGCLAGFLRARPRLPQYAQFAAGGILSIAYFLTIILTTGRQYIGLMKRVFHL